MEIPKFNANSVDPDQMSHSVASDLDLHSLSITLLGVSRLILVKVCLRSTCMVLYNVMKL